MAADIADDTAGDAVVRYDAVDALQKAISKLPAGQRSAIELLKLREMSLREAAAMTGMSISGAQGVGSSRGQDAAGFACPVPGRVRGTGMAATDALLMKSPARRSEEGPPKLRFAG